MFEPQETASRAKEAEMRKNVQAMRDAEAKSRLRSPPEVVARLRYFVSHGVRAGSPELSLLRIAAELIDGYVRHREECPRSLSDGAYPTRCSCGLDELLS